MKTKRKLSEDLLPIICDIYASTRQLGSLATVSRLNHRISRYARTRLFKQFEFVDDRSSRVLEHANTLCQVYEDGELLDEDILSLVDSNEIDPLELDPELRWLKGMRTCETIIIKDLLYGRDIESIITVSTSLSERGLVLFPKVKKMVIGGKLVKRILATEKRGPTPKSTPLGLLVALFHSTRPRILCIQDSAIFTPPRPGSIQMITRQIEVGGRLSPSRRGHVSNTITQFIELMESIQEIRYHAVNPDIPIQPKKGIHHVVDFIPDPDPDAVIRTFSLRRSHEEKIVNEIKDIISRSVAGRVDVVQETGMSPGDGGGGGGEGLFRGGPVGQDLFGGAGGGALFGAGTFWNGLGGAELFGSATGDGTEAGLFGTGAGNGRLFGQATTFETDTHAHFPHVPFPLVHERIQVDTLTESPFSTGTGDSTGASTTTSAPTSDRTRTSIPSADAIGGFSIVNTSTNAVAGPSTRRNLGINGNRSTRPDGDTDNSLSDTDDELPQYAPPAHNHVPRTRPAHADNERDLGKKQSSWHFILSSREELEDVKQQILFWADGIEGDIGDDVRAGISFGVHGKEGCDCDCGI